MNIQQLEYILAVDTYRHFAKSSRTLQSNTTYAQYDDTKTGRRTWH